MSGPRIRSICVVGPMLAASILLAAPAAPATPKQASSKKSTPPPARREVVVDSVFGMRLEDPYRWMEKPDNAEFLAWMRSQGEFTRRQLDGISGRAGIAARIRELSFETASSFGVQHWGSMLFYQRLDAGSSLPKLVVRAADGSERVLVDPKALSGSGKPHLSLDNYSVSPDGGLVAYNLAEGGGEITRVHVLETATGAEKPDGIERIWGEFPVTWLPDASGFFYTQMAEEGFKDPKIDRIQGMRVRLHKLGTPPADDPVVLGPGSSSSLKMEPREFPIIDIPLRSEYAIAYGGGARAESRVYIARLRDVRPEGTSWRRVAEYEDHVEGVTLADSSLYLLSSKDAPNRRILRVPLSNPDLASAQEVVPQGERVLVSVASAKDGLYTIEIDNGIHRVFRLLHGQSVREEVPLPVAGSVSGLFADLDHEGAIFSLEGWTQPRAYYEYRPQTQGLADLGLRLSTPADFSGILVERVEARSFDGTMIPLTILRRKDAKLDKSHPAILNGYAGYGISIEPNFLPTRLAWLERGGILAYAHVRGGGEKGRAWYLAGKGPNKPNSIRDFIACAEYLAANGYTTPAKLAAWGGSMGGVLVGGAIVQRPDAFGAAIIGAGILNPARFLQGTNGANQLAELGSPDTEEGFRALLAMDPTLAIQDKGRYPAVLLGVGLNDNRVSPWHSGKFAARLQAADGTSPVFIRIESEAGHGVGSTRDQSSDLVSDVYSFLLWRFGDRTFAMK